MRLQNERNCIQGDLGNRIESSNHHYLAAAGSFMEEWKKYKNKIESDRI